MSRKMHQRPFQWQNADFMYLAKLCNQEIAEIFTDFFWISLVLKGLVGKLF